MREYSIKSTTPYHMQNQMVISPWPRNKNKRFNLKMSRKNVEQLSGGESNHHSISKIMNMRLLSRNLEENYEENAQEFGTHSEHVYNNHRPTDSRVVHRLQQHTMMLELYETPTWVKFTKSITELKNYKSPGFNG